MTPSQREIWVDAPGPLARLRTRGRNSAYARLRPVRQRWTKLRGRDAVEPTAAAGPAFEVAGDFPPLAGLEAVITHPAILQVIERRPETPLTDAAPPAARMPLGADQIAASL